MYLRLIVIALFMIYMIYEEATGKVSHDTAAICMMVLLGTGAIVGTLVDIHKEIKEIKNKIK